MTIDGSATESSSRAIVRPGPEAAQDAPDFVQYLVASGGRMRTRTVSAEPLLTGGWEQVEDGGAGFMLSAFHPDGTDLVTLLQDLTVVRVLSEGRRGVVRTDLARMARDMLGFAITRRGGTSAFPLGSIVDLDLASAGSDSWRLHIDGDAISAAVRQTVDPRGQLDGALAAHDVYVTYGPTR